MNTAPQPVEPIPTTDNELLPVGPLKQVEFSLNILMNRAEAAEVITVHANAEQLKSFRWAKGLIVNIRAWEANADSPPIDCTLTFSPDIVHRRPRWRAAAVTLRLAAI
jgi:hypothetical protein